MKKVFIAILLALFFTFRVQAQGPIKVYLPMIITPDIDNNWRIIQPLASVNKIDNPSAEIGGNFSAVGGATATRSTTYQKYGLYSYRVQTSGDNEGISLDIAGSNLNNALHWATIRVRGTLPDSWDWSLDNSTYTRPRLIEKIDGNWDLYGLSFPAEQANGASDFYIRQNGAGSGDFYLDGIQVEENTVWTTYIDGTQEGCAWLGIPHNSASERSGESRAGGVSYDFWEQYKFQVQKIVGAGASSHNLGIDSYAILPGGELNSDKIESRDFNIIGKFITDSEEELHEMRQELEAAFQTDDNQLTRIRFNGAAVQKEIAVRYSGGLEGNLAAFYGDIEIVEDDQYMVRELFTEKTSIQVVAPFPYWQEVGESVAILDTNDSATFRLVAGRLKSTGQWDEMGPPGGGGTYTIAYAVAEDDTYVYVGGNFLNFDGIANADYIVRWHKVNQSWSALGSGMNNIVFALAAGPDGTLYAGGRFTTAGGGAANRIASWNGSSWSALSTGMNSDVHSLTFLLTGNLIAGGDFTTPHTRITEWDGSAFSALGGGADDSVRALAVGLDGTLFAGGDFGNMGGVANTTFIASWNGTVWSDVGGGLGDEIYALAVNPAGLLYIGIANFGASDFVLSWNGTAYNALGDGVNADVYALDVGPDDVLYAGGGFTEAGGIDLADRVARWNNFAWAHLDVDLPGVASVRGIVASKFVDPVVEQIYDLFVVFDTTGTGNYGGLVTVTNEGSVQAFPKIIYARSGGTSATVETLKNERTGRELLFDYDLLDGETLEIDLGSTQKSIISSFFGLRLDAVLANSDFGIWSLPRGDSDITSFVNVAGGPTVTAYLQWRDAYSGYD